jgi:hypothetical protein
MRPHVGTRGSIEGVHLEVSRAKVHQGVEHSGRVNGAIDRVDPRLRTKVRINSVQLVV